jgi:hypothetical protein
MTAMAAWGRKKKMKPRFALKTFSRATPETSENAKTFGEAGVPNSSNHGFDISSLDQQKLVYTFNIVT